jgi:hypothetical protein
MDQCASMMTNGYVSLKEMSDKLNVSIPTAFEWRHKILSGMKNNPSQFDGTVELQSIELAFSRKGLRVKNILKRNGATVKMLIVADSNNSVALHLSKIGKLILDDISDVLKEKLSSASQIVSPFSEVFLQFKKVNQQMPITLHSHDRHRLCEKTPQTNMLASQLKNWIYLSMRGVSTKYLTNYAHWFGHINELAKNISYSAVDQNLKSNKFAWALYAAREKIYHRFMLHKAEEEYVCSFAKEWKTAGEMCLLFSDSDFD